MYGEAMLSTRVFFSKTYEPPQEGTKNNQKERPEGEGVFHFFFKNSFSFTNLKRSGQPEGDGQCLKPKFKGGNVLLEKP